MILSKANGLYLEIGCVVVNSLPFSTQQKQNLKFAYGLMAVFKEMDLK